MQPQKWTNSGLQGMGNTCAARDQLSAAKVGTFYNMAIIIANCSLPFPIDLSICLSFKSTLPSKAYEHYDRRARHPWSNKDELSLERDRKRLCKKRAQCALHHETWWDTIFAHTWSMKASINHLGRRKVLLGFQGNTVIKTAGKSWL